MKSVIKNTLILVAITLTAALCLAVVYAVTKNRIAEAEAKERMDSFYTVMADTDVFDKIDESEVKTYNEDHKSSVVEAYNAYGKDGGFIGIVVSVVSHNGYGGDIVLSVGVDTDGLITGMKVTSMSETSGLGANCQNEEWTSQFAGKASPLTYKNSNQQSEDNNAVDALTSATITTKAVLEAVNSGTGFALYELGKGGESR